MMIRLVLVLVFLFPVNSFAKQYDFTTYKAYDNWWRAMNHNETRNVMARVLKNYKFDDYYYIKPYTLSASSIKQFRRCNKMLQKVDAIVNKTWFAASRCDYINTSKPGIILSIKQLDNSDIVAYHAVNGQRGLVPVNSLISVNVLGKEYFDKIMNQYKKSYLGKDYASN